MLRNIKLIIEYDGLAFSGWQSQPHRRTIQQAIEEVLHRITREKINLIGASRTDAGVHALGQVANFKIRHPISCHQLILALNGLLSSAVSIRKVEEVSPRFHSTKDAKQKIYHYRIWNSPHRSALSRDRAWHVYDPLNVGAMRRATQSLTGRHDFAAFRGSRSDTKTSVRTIRSICFSDQGKLLTIEFKGDGFLKYMVRNIVGTLVEVGRGRLKSADVGNVLRSKDRKKAGRTAPAYGLYLVSVRY